MKPAGQTAWFLPLALLLSVSAAAAPGRPTLLDCAPVVLPHDVIPYAALLDHDGDGQVEAVGHWLLEHELHVVSFENVDGRLEPSWSDVVVTLAPWPRRAAGSRVSVGDIDGDGRDDFAVAAGSKILIYEGREDGAAFLQQVPLALGIGDLEMVDTDGDGLDELAAYVLSEGPGASGLIWIADDGIRWATRESVIFGSTDEVQLANLELTGDDGEDIAVLRDGQLSMLSRSSGMLALHGALDPELSSPLLTAGDVDGDELDEIVLFTTDGHYRVVFQPEPGAFLLGAVQEGGPAAHLADVDGDGDLDGVRCTGSAGEASTGPDTPSLAFESRFEVALNDGAGDFADAFSLGAVGAEHLAGVADIDGDGDADLVAGRVIHHGDGFACPPTTELPVIAPSTVVDHDGDGDLDLAFGHESVLVNDGRGHFVAAPVSAPAPPPGTWYADSGVPGDFDGDGDPDLLVEHHRSGAFLGVRLLENDGTGTLFDGGLASTERLLPDEITTPSGAKVVDVDGDDDLDVIASAVPTGSVIWANDGAGRFTRALDMTWPTVDYGEQRLVLGVADVTRDGRPDLLLGSIALGSPPLHVARGLVGGRFDVEYVPIPFDPDWQEHWPPVGDPFDVADLDGDGWPDVVMVTHLGLQFFRSSGASPGYFRSGVIVDTTLFDPPTSTLAPLRRDPWGLHLVHLDEDDRLDLLVSPLEHEAGASLALLSDGRLPPYWETGVLLSVDPSCLADVDGDGDLDAIGRRVVRNLRGFGCWASGAVDPYPKPVSGRRGRLAPGPADLPRGDAMAAPARIRRLR